MSFALGGSIKNIMNTTDALRLLTARAACRHTAKKQADDYFTCLPSTLPYISSGISPLFTPVRSSPNDKGPEIYRSFRNITVNIRIFYRTTKTAFPWHMKIYRNSSANHSSYPLSSIFRLYILRSMNDKPSLLLNIPL